MEKFITACRRWVKISSIHAAGLALWALWYFVFSAENKLYLYDNRDPQKSKGTSPFYFSLHLPTWTNSYTTWALWSFSKQSLRVRALLVWWPQINFIQHFTLKSCVIKTKQSVQIQSCLVFLNDYNACLKKLVWSIVISVITVCKLIKEPFLGACCSDTACTFYRFLLWSLFARHGVTSERSIRNSLV